MAPLRAVLHEQHVRRGGGGPALLLLLHGLGANADVWDPLLPHVEDRCRWAAVDLPGHGSSAPLPRYSFGALAAAVAPVAGAEEPLVVLDTAWAAWSR